MNLPRFGIRAILIATTIAAIWLSTLAGYPASNDILALIWVAMVVTSGVAALNHTGRKRAFWTGFFGTMFLGSYRPVLTGFGANFRWSANLARELTEQYLGGASGRGIVVLNVNSTVIALNIIVGAIIIGFLSVCVYDKTQE